MPSNAAKILLLGKESTWGASTTPTIKVHGLEDATLTVVSKSETIPAVGWFGPSPLTEEVYHGAEGSWEMVASYEDIRYVWNGLFTGTTASTGSTGPFPYSWEPPIASTQACHTFNMEYGTTGYPYKLVGGIIANARVRGEAGSLWRVSADVLGRKVIATTARTTSVDVDRTVHAIAMKDTKLYIDPATGTVGTSTQDAQLISFELTMDPKRHLKQFAGSRLAGNWGDNKMEGKLSLLMEFTTNIAGGAAASTAGFLNELVDTNTGSTGGILQKLIRLRGFSNTLSGGATSGTLKCDIDFAGTLNSPVKLWDDRDGNMTVRMDLDGYFSTRIGTAGNWMAVSMLVAECSGVYTTE